MDKQTEALKLALETAEGIASCDWRKWEELASPEEFERWVKSRAMHMATALREALAEQPAQQEPVAYIRKDQLQKAAQSPMLCEVTPEPRQDRIGIHTSPQPRKPWVGLTDEERNTIYANAGTGREAMKVIEAKLREKNQ